MAAVHLSPPVAQWVVDHGGLDAAEMVQKNSELFPVAADGGGGGGSAAVSALPLFLTPAAARALQNGAVMARLLAHLFRANGAECPARADALAPGNEAAVVLRNWKEVLLPVLRTTFAIELSADKLALLVGGDSEVLTLLVETLCKRATGVAAADDAAAAARHRADANTPAALLQKVTKRFDADVMDTIYLFGSLVTGLYAAVLASLLGIFVPQQCPPNDAYPDWHVCGVAENLKPQSALNGAVLVCNFATLLLVLGGQAFFGYREWWCIESFDFDPALPNDNLAQEVHLYPAFAAKLRAINRGALRLAAGITALLALNFLLSAVHVLRGDFSAGKASATALVSYTLLLAPRVLGWLINAYKAAAEAQPVSFFIKIAAQPNTIDADWKYKPAVYKPRYGMAAAAGGSGRGGGHLAPAAAAGAEERIELLMAA
jgi:hypothetical protein